MIQIRQSSLLGDSLETGIGVAEPDPDASYVGSGHRSPRYPPAVVEIAADAADTVNRMSATREAVCEGCGQTTMLPMIQFDEADDSAIIEALCDECEQNFGMQIGASVRLLEPDESDDTVVHLIHPEENAIRVRSFNTGDQGRELDGVREDQVVRMPPCLRVARR